MTIEALRQYARPRTVATFAAAALLGLGIGTLVQSDPVALPYVGETSQYLVGAGGLLAGGGLYAIRPGSSDCDCSGPCGC